MSCLSLSQIPISVTNIIFEPIFESDVKSVFFAQCDIQRTRYPTANKFSYRSKTLGVKYRLDFFLISKHLTKFVNQTSIAPDHNMILLSLSWPNDNPRGPGFWKFNNSLLEGKEYTTKILELYPQLRDKISLCKWPTAVLGTDQNGNKKHNHFVL